MQFLEFFGEIIVININNFDMKIKVLFISIIIGFAVSCNMHNDPINYSEPIIEPDTLFINIVNIYQEFDLCEPDSLLYPILDLVEKHSNECPLHKKNDMLHCLWFYDDDDSLTRINIELREQKRMFCKSISNIFTYKGLIFGVISSKEYQDYFYNTGLKGKYLCMKNNDVLGNYNDKVFASWEFILDEESISCVSYGFCDQHWKNEKIER